MTVSSSTVITYESRETDTVGTYALFKVTTTTTIRTAPDTPEGTTVTESLDFLEIDYSRYHDRLINNLEISDSSSKLGDRINAISSDLEEIKNNQFDFIQYVKESGFNFTNTFDILNFIPTYRYLFEDKEILKEKDELTGEESNKIKSRIDTYIDRIRKLRKN